MALQKIRLQEYARRGGSTGSFGTALNGFFKRKSVPKGELKQIPLNIIKYESDHTTTNITDKDSWPGKEKTLFHNIQPMNFQSTCKALPVGNEQEI